MALGVAGQSAGSVPVNDKKISTTESAGFHTAPEFATVGTGAIGLSTSVGGCVVVGHSGEWRAGENGYGRGGLMAARPGRGARWSAGWVGVAGDCVLLLGSCGTAPGDGDRRRGGLSRQPSDPEPVVLHLH